MHVIVNPAPLLRYTYTSAPLTATSWGPPDNHIRVGWDRPGVHKVVAPDGCLRARGTTLVGSHAHEPVGGYYHTDSVEGRGEKPPKRDN